MNTIYTAQYEGTWDERKQDLVYNQYTNIQQMNQN